MSGQFHLDAETYLEMIRAEIPGYDSLQSRLAGTTRGLEVHRVLDLGSGTGETARAIIGLHPGAELVGIDGSDEMLRIARDRVPAGTFLVSRLEDELPGGPFDVVLSAFAVHHLDGSGKADLFRRIADVLSPGGSFAMLDVVVPLRSAHDAIRLEPGVDQPSSVPEMLEWLEDAGLAAEASEIAADLAIIVATSPQ